MTRTTGSDGRGGRRTPPASRKSPAATLLAVALVLAVLAGAVFVYTMTNKKAAQAQPTAGSTAETQNPFADIPPEAPPEKQARTKGQK